MQRRQPTEMSPSVRAECVQLARAADPEDSYRKLAVKVADALNERQVRRRVEAMERDLGLAPADPTERGGGRPPRDGGRVQHSRPYRRAGRVARDWLRRCTEDCL